MISRRRIGRMIVMIVIAILSSVFVPRVMARNSGQTQESAVAGQVQTLKPLGMEMVDEAMTVLKQGWVHMSPEEKEIFLTLYDPAGSGEVDAEFVQDVIDNYEKIQRTLGRDISIVYEPDNDFCSGKRLYFTVLNTIRVCPYFFSESDDTRKARALVHEVAHIALFVRDRPYYRPTSKAFAQLTPRGPWTAQLPLIGPLVREMVAADTLYHPDTYAHFAQAMSGQPGVMDAYLDQGPVAPVDVNLDEQQAMRGVTDSWLRP